MDRKLNKEDFAAVNEEIVRLSVLEKGEETEHVRDVCSDYDIIDGTILARFPYDEEHFGQWRHYDPLIDAPDLFLQFAKLYDQGLSEALILEWTRKYGLLGLGTAWGSPFFDEDSVREVKARDVLGEKLSDTLVAMENPLDRPAKYQALSVLLDYNSMLLEVADPLKGFQDEAIIAAAVLKMYEAALSKNKEEAKKLVLFEFPFMELMHTFNRPFWKPLAQHFFGESRAEELRTAIFDGVEETNDFATHNQEAATEFILHFGTKLSVSPDEETRCLEQAFSNSTMIAEHRVRALCYPEFVLSDPKGEYVPDNLQSGWGYRNLLGVMYLQMHWLITSGSEIARCEHCGRIISLAKTPVSGARKPPRHKRFCNEYCRYNHYYQTKKKPAREEGSSS